MFGIVKTYRVEFVGTQICGKLIGSPLYIREY